MKTKPILIASGAAIAVLGLSYYFFIHKPQKEAEEDPTKFDVDKPLLWIGCNDNFPIKPGSCGERVKLIQQYLNKKSRARADFDKIIAEDGKFGKNTSELANKFMSGTLWGTGLNEYEYNQYKQYF